MFIYGATQAATGLVGAAIAATPGLYGQGDPAAFAPREERVRAGLELLTAHGFRLNRIHQTGLKIGMPGGFGYEGTVIPASMRFSGLGSGYQPRSYRPDDPGDYPQFIGARTEADSLGYQFYRARAPFGPAEFVVDGEIPETDTLQQMFERRVGGVRLYNPYSGDGTQKHPFEEVILTIRRYLDLNPEFADFAGFVQGWRAKSHFSWTVWDMLQAQSDNFRFSFGEGVRDWYLDPEFGLTALISDPETGVLSFVHPDGRRAFMTLDDALAQIHLENFPVWKPEQRSNPNASLGNHGYVLEPEDVITVNPMLEIRWHGFRGTVNIPRKLY